MFLNTLEINNGSMINEIVAQDYRTAAVFRKYGMEFCCGGRKPLQVACDMYGVDVNKIKEELRQSIRNIQLHNTLHFNEWPVDFLIDFIKNVHHQYLLINLPEISDVLPKFVDSHRGKFNYADELLKEFNMLENEILPLIEQEENIIFPYIRQISHAYSSKASYAALLVRTLRKPLENIMHNQHRETGRYLTKMRKLTNNYHIPPGACVTHRVCLSKLLELDNDLTQHIHLENNILLPRVIMMEKELLES
jgi:regulator of cell morphogenesis and NO signaling